MIDFRNFSQFFTYDKKTNISIVFPSENILNYECGDIIDKSDVVIRFNDYEIANYERYVGIKTDIILCNKKTFNSNFLSNKKNVKIYAATISDEVITYIKNNNFYINSNEVVLIDYKKCIPMLTKIYNIPIKQPTAGFLIIALLIYNNFSNVNIYGYESHKNSIYTYYYKDNKTDNDIIKWSSCHNYSNETDVLIKLHNEKKINIYGYK